MGSILIPSDELSLTDRKNHREDALTKGLARAVHMRVAGAENELTYRGFEPLQDGGAAIDNWQTAVIAVVAGVYSVFQAGAPVMVLPANKLVVFYKVGIETAPMPVSRLEFRHNAAAGNIIGVFDLEQLINTQMPVGYFSEAIVLDPQSTTAIQVIGRLPTGLLCNCQLGGYLIEPAGRVIS